MVRLALIAVLVAAPAAATTPTPTGTPMFVPTPPGHFTINGHIAAGPGCTGNRAGVQVSISPGGQTAVTGAGGRFRFANVTYGNYYLQFTPNCPLIPCYADQYVFVDATGDVALGVCRDDCPSEAMLSLRGGAPGSLLDVSGRCDAARNGASVEIWFDDESLGTLSGDADGVYRGTVTVPLDATPDAQHLIRAVLDGDEIATGTFQTVYGPQPCVGDCNRDGTVTIDELLRGIRIALQLDAPATCFSVDTSQNGVVSIEELIAGVQRALNGCQRPDLVPLGARFSRCIAPGCYAADQVTQFMEVCVANQGNADSGGFLIQDRHAGTYVFAPPLLAGTQECVEMPFGVDPIIDVDAGDGVAELDETNNLLEVSIPAPTACDVQRPPCTQTPTPTQSQTPTPT